MDYDSNTDCPNHHVFLNNWLVIITVYDTVQEKLTTTCMLLSEEVFPRCTEER